jgi:hypothetical protein
MTTTLSKHMQSCTGLNVTGEPMDRPTLVLIGCSWFCGEWIPDGEDSIRLGHPGITEYLSSDYHVVNLSRGGGSNWQSLYALHNYLSFNRARLKNITVIIGQTDPMRAAGGERYNVDYCQVAAKAHSFVQLCQELTEIFYIKLAAIADREQFRPQLVGGLSDVDVNIAGLYSASIGVLIPSWIQLLDPVHKPSVCPLAVSSRDWEAMYNYGRMDLVKEMMDLSDCSFLRAQALMETDWFGPAFGDFHPSRLAHQRMAQEITQRLG